MAEVVHDTQHEFWRSPTVLGPLVEALPAQAQPQAMTQACAECGSEFMIGARFCHICGLRRPALLETTDAAVLSGLWARNVAWTRTRAASVAAAWRQISFPHWLHYLHFHEIQRLVGLPTAALIAFIAGLGCMAGAMGVGLFYRASNLAEFQAIQLWRIEWLLAGTAAFVAGILLKKPSDKD